MRIQRLRRLLGCTATAFIVTAVSMAQSAPVKPPADPFAEIQRKFPGLLPELGHLLDRLKHDVQFPAEREQSNLLPQVPTSTSLYAAFPNYGETVHQALAIFRDELRQSTALRAWWEQGDMAKTGPQVEGFIEKFYLLSQYLGDEIVIAGGAEGATPSGVLVAEVRKPGLDAFLRQMLRELPEKPKTDIHILTPQELPGTSEWPKTGQVVILVRSDVVIAGSDLATVAGLNKALDTRNKAGEFAATPFGERIKKAYQGGAVVVAAANLHKFITQAQAAKPANPANAETLERSGFKDVKYLVWDHKRLAGKPVGEMELSFMSSRRGAASWLAAPAQLGSLDFVSPKSAIVASFRLKNLGEIFDDFKELNSSNPNAMGMLPQMEQTMHLSLRDDLLSQLQGEITIAVDELAVPQPQWKAILRIGDAERLQKTLARLLQLTPVLARQTEEDGIVYHSITIPSAQKPTQIVYAFIDEYLMIASSQQSITNAIQLRKSGESLTKSAAFLDALPPGYPREVSAMIYEDASAMTAFQLRQVSPEMAEAMSHLKGAPSPIVFCAYGEDKAIRAVSAGGGADAAGILVIAAIAMPNLIRARTAANESAAVATLRALDVAQTTYSSKYLQNGYARDLASLGPDPRDNSLKTARHAALIDADLGNANCGPGAWCEKSGYRFGITAMCQMRSCREFVAVATPVSFSTGSRSFCSTSDGVIRFHVGTPLTSPVSVAECMSWPPLQ